MLAPFAVLLVAAAAGGTPAPVPIAASACRQAPSIDLLRVDRVGDDSVTLSFLTTSDGPGTFALLFDPGDRGVARNFTAPGADVAYLRVGGFRPNRRYTATLVIRNACGLMRSAVHFTTLRAGGCTALPRITMLQAAARTATSGQAVFAFTSSGRGTFAITVDPGPAGTSASFRPPGGSAGLPISGLRPSTQYRVTLDVLNGCGTVSAVDTFRTPAAAPPSSSCTWAAYVLSELTSVTCATARTVIAAYFGSGSMPAGWDCSADSSFSTGSCTNGSASFRFRRE